MQVEKVIKPVQDSLIGWLGGKTKLRPTIINCMPPHKCYVEVFCGSATVFFGKPPKLSKIEIINDVHGELVNLMKVISGTYFDESVREEFKSYVHNMPAARAAHSEWKYWTPEQIEQLNPAQRAYRFYYCVKKGFSSVPKGGYEASPLASSRYNMNTDFDQFAARFRAKNAQIENLDFESLIEKYNRESADTFFYCDPPYFVADRTSYYDFIFDNDQHLKFKECCDQIDTNKNTFLITYDDIEAVLELYKQYHIYRTDPLIYSSSDERGERNLVKTELFITNYDLAEMIAARNKSSKSGRRDIFAEKIDSDDGKIVVPGHVGLTKVS